ncbi:hypothetical protein [Mesomycoplasma neurolyticum]|uniref:ATPase, AAA family n=1 Tax=Mesomycoplasma neurolyticum TaxID=2120 RepID=A0A449A511_9BACT|nr:hypothetical protein [Mesomycoplasma neurolyticum]VEU59335.1 ATPase, AAA family [Mesomycoplasma neurolyticum]
MHKVHLTNSSLFLPTTILDDIKGIINAIKHNVGVNKFLFYGQPGTGKTESAKQITKLLDKGLWIVDTNSLIDSHLG